MMSNSHCKKHDSAQEPKNKDLSVKKLSQLPLSTAAQAVKPFWRGRGGSFQYTPYSPSDVSLMPSFLSFSRAQQLKESPFSQPAYFKCSLLCVGNVERQTQFSQGSHVRRSSIGLVHRYWAPEYINSVKATSSTTLHTKMSGLG